MWDIVSTQSRLRLWKRTEFFLMGVPVAIATLWRIQDRALIKLTVDELQLRRYHAEGTVALVGQYIRKYLRDNKSTKATKIT